MKEQAELLPLFRPAPARSPFAAGAFVLRKSQTTSALLAFTTTVLEFAPRVLAFGFPLPYYIVPNQTYPAANQTKVQRKSPRAMIIPVVKRLIRQKPIMSLAPSFAIARAGIAQKGCMRFVHASPQAIAIAVIAGSTPSSAPAGIIIGACTAH